MDYINYHVEVTSDGQQVHITARHPDGTEAGQPRGPFCFAGVKDEVLTLADKAAKETTSRKELEQLGELLFGALFCDSAIGEHFRSTYRQARERGQGLRLELDFDESRLPEVAALPWEFLRAPETSGYRPINIATDSNLVLSRRRSLWEPSRRMSKAGLWRILLTVAAPDDPKLGAVAYEEVLQDLQRLTIQPEAGFTPVGEPLLGANSLKLDKALGNRPDILHFIGHGRFVADVDDPHGEVAMVDAGGWSDWLRDEDFGSLLERHVPAVIFLQACEGGTLGSARGLTGVASKLVQHNAPVVVAMQYPISNAAALDFAHKFYECLAAGDPVDKAAQEGRRVLSFKYRGRREFATPVLFMRTPDGRLFAEQSGDEQTEWQPRLPRLSGDGITATQGSTVVNRSPGASITPPSTPSSTGGINYVGGLKRMRELIQKQTPTMLNEFLTLESRLHENLSSAGLFGETETVRAERAQIVNALNHLAQRAKLSKTFNDLSLESIQTSQDTTESVELLFLSTPGSAVKKDEKGVQEALVPGQDEVATITGSLAKDATRDYIDNMKPIPPHNPQFFMASCLVSNQLYYCFVCENKYWHPIEGECKVRRDVDDTYLEHWGKGRPSDKEHGFPVTNISFRAAKAFANWLSELTGQSIRLPTLQEWQIAVKAGRDNWFDEEIQAKRVNYYGTTRARSIHAINDFGLNPFDIHDLLGNAYDMCISPEDSHPKLLLVGGCYYSTESQLQDTIVVNSETKCQKDASFRCVRSL